MLLGTDFGEGSLTDSGYPRLVKRGAAERRWKKPIRCSAPGAQTSSWRPRWTALPGSSASCCGRAIDFFNDDVYELRGSEFIRIDAPTDATVSVHRDWLLIELRTDWYRGDASYQAGSLLAADHDEFLAGTAELQVVFEPDEHTCLYHYAWTGTS